MSSVVLVRASNLVAADPDNLLRRAVSQEDVERPIRVALDQVGRLGRKRYPFPVARQRTLATTAGGLLSLVREIDSFRLSSFTIVHEDIREIVGVVGH